jgi:hypothetical protein
MRLFFSHLSNLGLFCIGYSNYLAGLPSSIPKAAVTQGLVVLSIISELRNLYSLLYSRLRKDLGAGMTFCT